MSNGPPASIARAIQATLAYFDLFDFPLTKEEIFRYLWQAPPVGYADFVEALAGARERWESQFGFFFLPGRQATVEARRRSAVESDQKLRRARILVRLVASVPFVRAIFLSGSVAAQTASRRSDLDWFIITAPGRVWSARFFVNLVLRLFGQRVYASKKSNRVCLCFFVDAEHFDLSPLQSAPPPDIHFAYWLHHMLPLYDPDNYFVKFISANRWTGILLPNYHALTPMVRSSGAAARRSVWKTLWETMWRGAYGELVENQLKAVQLMKLKPSLRAKVKLAASDVVIAPGVIKLHEHDTRAATRKRWTEKLAILGMSV